MKKDMVLARRIRGDRNFDHIDHQPKTGDEVFFSLPYSGGYKTDEFKKLQNQVAQLKQ